MDVINIDDNDDERSSANNNNSTPSRPEIIASNINNDDDDYEYRVILLMDHREFGLGRAKNGNNNFLKISETRINRHFNGKSCEILSLKAADYMFVARKISKLTGQVVDERLFDLIIERKDVGDLASCLIIDSKKYKPLKFFEAQMYKLVNCGIKRKIFLIEGDEDTYRWRTEGGGAASNEEKRKRRLRIKTIRLLVQHDHFKGVELVCTRFGDRTIAFLIYQMELLQKSFDPKDFAGMKTMQQFTDHIEVKMNDPTFQKYLELRRKPRVGDKKAMKVIRDPNEDWDKSFVSPSEKNNDIKSTEEDRATYWSRSSVRRQEDQAATQPPPPPPSAGNDQSSNATSNGGSSTINRSASNVSSSSSSSAASSKRGGATVSSARSSNGSASARANAKTTGEESQSKKRDTTKKAPYKKRQKVSEKLYIQRKPCNLKPSYSTPNESVSTSQNGYIPANPLHEARNSSLVAALLDERKPASKPRPSSVRKGGSVRSTQPCSVQSGTKPANEDFNYMLEFSEDDIEGQVVAMPTPRSKQTNKSDDVSPTVSDTRKKGDVSSTTNPAGKNMWHDDFKDVLESSDDDSIASFEKLVEPAGGAKKANNDDVIDLIDEDDDSVGSVIELLD
mmetsp:Transcript_27491/g.43237  ORF Transcript_27491/g.43237 Transcript_27491/m.43237 type:complete len:620 (-) Transcript_27491:1653-3512(-)|eukprot:CAMPEP_0201715506 /NCGR_PEP_ID=MMETSP0593-20130828/1671_1 /ASSEMBLY_ACC=CAM_ASM_000672 /TAXON_ID=267983 /ORGANISM="Skeletonema japonicum, Strain CCMP2506" /LENGTH=619 /DNA_ID=CAMNT_0048205023 /DNA_START=89 /DNA_END=1948 /DNA_ORIENTATION=+